jgi:hypothetical protein
MKRTILVLSLALLLLGAMLWVLAPTDPVLLAQDWHELARYPVLAMAVVTKYGTGYPDPTVRAAIDADKAEAHIKAIVSQITITNGDSIGSKFYLGRVPSNAIIDPRSHINTAAITGATDNDIGFFNPNGGAVLDADALVDGVTLAAAANLAFPAAGAGAIFLTPANMQKRAWELAGLTSDPGGFLDIVLTMNAAATATGVANVFINWFRKI